MRRKAKAEESKRLINTKAVNKFQDESLNFVSTMQKA